MRLVCIAHCINSLTFGIAGPNASVLCSSLSIALGNGCSLGWWWLRGRVGPSGGCELKVAQGVPPVGPGTQPTQNMSGPPPSPR